jgi:hypothetical protein
MWFWALASSFHFLPLTCFRSTRRLRNLFARVIGIRVIGICVIGVDESAKMEIQTKDKHEDPHRTNSDLEVRISPDGNVKDLLAAMSEEDQTRASDKQEDDKEEQDDDDEDDEEEDDEDAESADESEDETGAVADVAALYDENVVASTRHGYRLTLIRLVLYLAKGKKHKLILDNDFRAELLCMQKGRECGPKVIKAYILAELTKASRKYQPIRLEGSNKSCLTPDVFMNFLFSLSDTKGAEYMKSYGVFRSALTDLYGQCEVIPTDAFTKKMKRLYQGLKRRSARSRGAAGKKLGEGKDPMPFELYQALCKWLLEDDSKESIFGHCFLTMTWNLMCRSKNTVGINRQHIGWHGDAMTVKFSHSKKDMEGKDSGKNRHVYANPEMPEICCPTSTGRYLAAFPTSPTGKLFAGRSQYNRFRVILAKILSDHAEAVKRMGVDPFEIGVHSIRKGAATYCSSGTNCGPSFAAICNRSGKMSSRHSVFPVFYNLN